MYFFKPVYFFAQRKPNFAVLSQFFVCTFQRPIQCGGVPKLTNIRYEHDMNKYSTTQTSTAQQSTARRSRVQHEEAQHWMDKYSTTQPSRTIHTQVQHQRHKYSTRRTSTALEGQVQQSRRTESACTPRCPASRSNGAERRRREGVLCADRYPVFVFMIIQYFSISLFQYFSISVFQYFSISVFQFSSIIF